MLITIAREARGTEDDRRRYRARLHQRIGAPALFSTTALGSIPQARLAAEKLFGPLNWSGVAGGPLNDGVNCEVAYPQGMIL